jgi:hypothetical protein
MATQEDNRTDLGLPEITRERPIRAAKFRLDHTLIWLVALIALWFGTLFAARALGALYIAWLLAPAEFAYYILFVLLPLADSGKTTLLTKGFRTLNHKLRDVSWIENKIGPNVGYSKQPMTGEFTGSRLPDEVSDEEKEPPDPIEILGRVAFRPRQMKDGTLGIARDFRHKTRVGTMWATGWSLLGESPLEQAKRLEGWSSVLDSMADSRVHRLTWQDRTTIGELQYPLELLNDLAKGSNLQRRDSPYLQTFLNRTSEMGKRSIVHNTSFSLSIDATKVTKKERRATKDAVEAVLVAQLWAFYQAVMDSGMGVKTASFVNYNKLLFANRLAIDPVFAQSVWERWSREIGQEPLDETVAWPGNWDFSHSDYCKVGQTYHSGFFAQRYTPKRMSLIQLGPIVDLPIPKTVTSVFEPVPASRAARRAVWSSSSERAASIERQKQGVYVDEFQQASTQKALDHEHEVAISGSSVWRHRLYVDLTAPSLEVLHASERLLEAASRSTKIQFAPLTDRQHVGVEVAMPLARGMDDSMPVPTFIENLL